MAASWACHAPFSLKVQFIIKSGRGRPIRMPRPQSSGLKKPTIRPLNEVLLVYVLFLVHSKIDEIRKKYFRCTIASDRICSSWFNYSALACLACKKPCPLHPYKIPNQLESISGMIN